MLGKWYVAALAIVLVVGATALAATEEDVTLTVTIRSLGVDVDPQAYGFGVMNTGETKISDSALTVTNTGNDAEDIGIRIKTADDQGEWSAAATTGVDNEYVLSTRLAASAGTFVAGDVLDASVTWCDGTKFGGGGNDMAGGTSVNQWFEFQSPTSVSGDHANDEHTITVEVSCRQAE